MAVNERTYMMAVTTLVGLRQSVAMTLEWLAPLGPDAAGLIAGFQAIHDELYSAGEALDELAKEEFGSKYESPRFALLTEEEFKKSRSERRVESSQHPETTSEAG